MDAIIGRLQDVVAKVGIDITKLNGLGSSGNSSTTTGVKIIAGTAALAVSAYGIARILAERQKVRERGAKPIARADRALLRKKFAKKHVSGDGYDTIIVGSGMGSLSCAAVLARLGSKVLVLEQHPDVAGGGTHQYDLGGYRFDSGLHYTVPWSVPVFALTCLLRPEDVTPFDIMGEADGTIDNIYLSNSNAKAGNDLHFKMIMNEKHIPDLYKMYPEEKDAIDKYMQLSNDGMAFVKYYIFSRLLPQWLQHYYWAYVVPKRVIASASTTAEEVLPKLTSNKQLISLLSSMWIDTGARPDKASFTMTASVFRGITMEGGCYPSRGSEEMAIELARVITDNGGSIFINARVKEIVVSDAGSVQGVMMDDVDRTVIKAKRVVSGAGYATTFRSLINKAIVSKLEIPESLKVPQSAGFVMVNIGMKATAEEVGAETSNTWHIPVDDSNDAFGPMKRYFSSPTSVGMDMPAFITFPSCKDKKWSQEHPGRVSCQMLFMAEYDWFKQFTGPDRKSATAAQYNAIKDEWKASALKVFYKYYPKAKGKVDFVDISTPLSAEDYLNAYRGGAVGIDVTPDRFVDEAVRRRLDVVVPEIKGLYLTGQDSLLCGVTLAQLAGVITAFRMEGFFASMKILFSAILLT